MDFMRRALQLAAEAAADGETPVGAVVVRDGIIVGEGRNRREKAKNALCHAELEAIQNACTALGGWRLWACELFVTLEPCPMCAGAIINARLRRLVYGAADPKAGCCGSVTDLFALPFNHRPAVEAGLCAAESAALLRGFFQSLRSKKQMD
jgi:tRNA(adenine34) deaminase